MEDRCESEQYAGGRCHTECEEQHERIDVDPARPRQTIWKGSHEGLHALSSEPHAQKAATERQQHTFRHELPEQAPAAGAKRRQHRQLTATCLGTGEQHIRQIRAGNQ